MGSQSHSVIKHRDRNSTSVPRSFSVCICVECCCFSSCTEFRCLKPAHYYRGTVAVSFYTFRGCWNHPTHVRPMLAAQFLAAAEPHAGCENLSLSFLYEHWPAVARVPGVASENQLAACHRGMDNARGVTALALPAGIVKINIVLPAQFLRARISCLYST